MKLNLTRPLAFFDLEATGLDRENDRIVEIAICKLMPDGSKDVIRQLVNPGIPIPEASSKIHGITDQDVADKSTFNQLADEIFDCLKGCDIAGYNSNNYDLPMLYNHFRRAGIDWDYHAFLKIDVGTLFKRKEERTLTAAVKFYCQKELENAHSAEADILATVDVFLAQLERYPDLPESLEELQDYTNYDKKFLDLSGKFTTNNDGVIVFNFGKYKDQPAQQYPDFLEWMLRADFPSDTCKICNVLLQEYYNRFKQAEKQCMNEDNGADDDGSDEDWDLPF